MTRAVAAACSLVLAGCAGPAMNRAVASWQGAKVDQVVRQWMAPPTRVFDADGSTFHQWAYDRGAIVPAVAFSGGQTAGGFAVVAPRSCVITFETAAGSADIVGGAWEGNDCCVMTAAGWCSNLLRK